MIKIDWKKYFDQIFCISFLPTRKMRSPRIIQELTRVGIIDSGIFQWKYCFKSPFYAVLRNSIPIRHENVKTKQSQFDISLTHYEIYKFAYEMEYSRILILEDDIVFLKDLNELQSILDATPNTDIVLYDKFAYNKQQFLSWMNLVKDKTDKFFSFQDSFCFFGSAGCYSLTRKALATFIEQEEQCFYAPDELWNNWNDNVKCNALTKSCAITNIAVQKQFDISNSGHIIDGFYNNINLDKEKYAL